jgi:O-antigen/teichoic acid export membrane protein
VVFVGVRWALGAGYEDVPLLLVVLIPNVIAYAGMSPLYSFFSVQAAKPAMLLMASGPGLLANVGLTVILTPMWGLWGAAVAASGAGLLAVAVALRCFTSETRTPVRQLRPGRRELDDYVALISSFAARLSRS